MVSKKRLNRLGVLAGLVVTVLAGYYALGQLGIPLRSRRFLHVYNVTKPVNAGSLECIKTKTIPKFYICPYSPSEDVFISSALMTDGIWERKMTELFGKILKRERTLTVVDIGANIGYFSLLSASLGHPVVAAEPNEDNLQRFKVAINLNKFDEKMVLVKNAVSNSRREVTLRLVENNKGGHRIQRELEMEPARSLEYVDSITLTDLLRFIDTPDVLLKIDVEGHECKILEAAEEFFNAVNVKHIIMEWNKMTFVRHIYGVSCTPISIITMTERLVRRGYRAYDVIQNRPIDVQESDKWTYGDVYWRKEYDERNDT